MGMSNTFTVLVPTIVFVVGTVISLSGLGYAMKTIPVGTAYAVWTGIGAALTVVYAVITGTEIMTVGKAIFLVGIIGAVIGLKLVEDSPREAEGLVDGGDAGEPAATSREAQTAEDTGSHLTRCGLRDTK